MALPADLADGQTASADADGTPVMLARVDDAVYAIHNRCSHRGCLLSAGELNGTVVTCSCHGSRFDVRDGRVLRGPAITGQPVFETREAADRWEVRRPVRD